MPFVKVQKSKAYYKRYQVKFARRRAGKTDYRARKRLVAQDKNKYAAPRYRLVVRLTSHYVICQIVYSEIDGDRVFAAAYSSELGRYGLKVGLKNYAAAYCTGLLVARRALQKFNMDEAYPGNEEITGEIVSTTTSNEWGRKRTHWVAEVSEERKPFRAVLDVGIRATTTGARVFAALKGAADGGLDIPHNEKRFPGYLKGAKDGFKGDEHRSRIMGEHVADFMNELKEDDPEAFEKRFSQFVAAGVDPDDMEDLYTAVHEAIRADPSPAPKKVFKSDFKYKNPARLTLEERKARVTSKKVARLQSLQQEMNEEDDE